MIKNDEKAQIVESQESLIKLAQDAASKGDPRSMADFLWQSGYINGLNRTMNDKWSGILDIENIVAEATFVLYENVTNGKKVVNLKSYLWKTADNLAFDFYSAKKLEDALEDNSDKKFAAPAPLTDDKTDPYDELEPEEKRKMAINIARSLIASLGQENIQQVMTYIFDAIELDIQDITDKQICEALGYANRATVRKWIERGFDRLAARACEQGILSHEFDVAKLREMYGG